MKIAIIGMGVTGISVLREWTKEKRIDPSIEITVFGDRCTFGTGFTFQEDSEALLTNQVAETTTIIPENRFDFVEWLENNHGEENAKSKYYPRQLFGTYINERMNEWLEESKAEIIKHEIEAIQILPNKQIRLTWSSGIEEYDAVHLCIGALPYKDPYHLIDQPNFISNPYPVNKNLFPIPEGVKVGILGTGLTSIDIFRYISHNRPDLKLSFFSHSGRFKSIGGKSKKYDYAFFTEENIKHAKEQNNGFIPLETYIDWLKKEVEHQLGSSEDHLNHEDLGSINSIKKELNASDELTTLQILLGKLDPLLTDLWMSLDEKDKQTFFDTYYQRWDKLRSPFPPSSAEELVSAWEENKISVFENLIDITHDEHSFKFVLKNEVPQYTDYLINAAGSEMDVSFEMNQMPLLSQLLNERILQSETFGGVQVSVPDLSAVSQRYGVLHALKIHGPLISGIEFGNNSVNIISASAKPAVQDIVQQIKNK